MATTLPSAVVLDEAWPDEPEIRGLLDAVVAGLRDDPHAMVQAVLDGMRREVSAYSALSEEDARIVAQGVVHTVTTFIGLLAERRRLTPEEVDGIVAIGTVRASQGVSADDMLTAVRVALRWGWAHMVDRAAAVPVSPATPAVLGRLGAEAFEYMQQAAAAMARGADEHARSRLPARARAERELVEEVLAGAFGTDDDIVQLGVTLDVDLTRPVLLLLFAAADRGDCRVEPLRRVKERLVAELPAVIDCSLRAQPVLHAALVIPVGPADDTVARAVAAAVAEGAMVVVEAPEPRPSALLDAYRRGCALLDVARRVGRPPGLVDGAELAAHRLLAAAEPGSARTFDDDVLGPVLALPEARRTRMLEALEAALATKGTMNEAGDRLGVHAKTVATRLRELERHTGLRVDRADERLLLELAVILHRLHPD